MGFCKHPFAARLIFIIISAEVPAGARSPYHDPVAYSGNPAKTILGINGDSTPPFLLVTARAFRRLLIMIGATATVIPTVKSLNFILNNH